ncbi:N-acetylglucosamine-6-phosphate deacetylase [Larsenimonas rhizosphaerae]|uniref:N-acetylglucosamine-6-phosphate deacetylase n=1 Tax=Larsenimonas rhizosphaerae TaxID=2944682 RepID=UPI0020333648|nr:N-acetylglucosamine-6-phosphate deacetylase [Larsenimonas rhizosphaerae]MCM2130872.1 N-acetylglucosamine-6-phosphate deacetylase [Larsenimonas rhizosphaerae]
MRLTGYLLTPDGWLDGTLTIRDGIIDDINGVPVTPRDNDTPRILPGFIDLHVHGGGGRDAMEGGMAPGVLARTHARFGTTSVLVTTMTAPMPDIEQALDAVAEAMASDTPSGADILGVHLEGPFIHPDKLGAQPAFARPGSSEQMMALMAHAPIRVVTLAPEIDGHTEMITFLAEQGVRVQVGHSCGCYQDGVTALAAGASGFTHLFNAMTGVSHRDPGIATAALAHSYYAEIIPDLVHVEQGAMLTAMRAIPCLYGVTDATAAAGMPDGEYKLGAHRVYKHGNSVRLEDGTLAGSALTMDQAFRNWIALGDSWAVASRRLSTWPARYLGLEDRGELLPGKRADLVVMGRDRRLQRVLVNGQEVNRDVI